MAITWIGVGKFIGPDQVHVENFKTVTGPPNHSSYKVI